MALLHLYLKLAQARSTFLLCHLDITRARLKELSQVLKGKRNLCIVRVRRLCRRGSRLQLAASFGERHVHAYNSLGLPGALVEDGLVCA